MKTATAVLTNSDTSNSDQEAISKVNTTHLNMYQS